MCYVITNAAPSDLPEIYLLFEEAIRFQKANNYIGWNNYDKEWIKADIKNGLLFKLICHNETAGVFSICFSDALIWRERETGNAVYLHRIVINRKFAGRKMFNKVLAGAIQLAKSRGLNYIRMDTWAENDRIIAYYKSYGFLFIENYTTPGTEDLPVQHRNLHVALLEKEVMNDKVPIYGEGVITMDGVSKID
ncbi:MAG: GNAT family N-acetyltransferase [Williamsia sp.]|nr:GNAT family N-acetyltransferase [Williamsia sp.]